MEELQARVTAEQGEKAELINRSKMLVQTLKVCSCHGSHPAHWQKVSPAHAPHYSCRVLLQLRKEELRQLRARQAAPADAEEDALSREFAGSVTLTFREDRTVTLTPAQAGPRAQLVIARRAMCGDAAHCTSLAALAPAVCCQSTGACSRRACSCPAQLVLRAEGHVVGKSQGRRV